MNAMQVAQHAQALYRTHGNKAELEAAQKARETEARGKRDESRNWRRIQSAIRQLRGPRET